MRRRAEACERAYHRPVIADPARLVVLKTAHTADERIVDMLPGDQLPRIC